MSDDPEWEELAEEAYPHGVPPLFGSYDAVLSDYSALSGYFAERLKPGDPKVHPTEKSAKLERLKMFIELMHHHSAYRHKYKQWLWYSLWHESDSERVRYGKRVADAVAFSLYHHNTEAVEFLGRNVPISEDDKPKKSPTQEAQIYQCIRQYLEEEERMPSKGEVSKRSGISLRQVQKVYADIQERTGTSFDERPNVKDG